MNFYKSNLQKQFKILFFVKFIKNKTFCCFKYKKKEKKYQIRNCTLQLKTLAIMCVTVPWWNWSGPLLLRLLLFGYCGRNLTSRAPAQTLYSNFAHIIVFCGQCKSKLESGSLRQSLLHFLADGRSALVIKMHIYWRWRRSHRAKCLECRRRLPFSLAASRVWQPFSSNHHLLLVSGDASKAAETLIKIILFCGGGVFDNPFSIHFPVSEWASQ